MTLGYRPVWSLSVFNWKRPGIISMILKAYYDGSGKSPDKLITLAGFVATPECWEDFERSWATVLTEHEAPFLHMSDLQSSSKPFNRENGWDDKRKQRFLRAIHNKCFSQNWDKWRGKIVAASCTVNMDDYRKAIGEFPRLKTKEAEAICVDYVVTTALRMLPSDPNSRSGKKGSVEIVFDRKEPFLHKINRVWQKHSTKPPFCHIPSIVPASWREVYPLQAADYLAWHINRFYATNDMQAKVKRLFAGPGFTDYIDYAKLAEKYGRET